jgi:hypothetical protein
MRFAQNFEGVSHPGDEDIDHLFARLDQFTPPADVVKRVMQTVFPLSRKTTGAFDGEASVYRRRQRTVSFKPNARQRLRRRTLWSCQAFSCCIPLHGHSQVRQGRCPKEGSPGCRQTAPCSKGTLFPFMHQLALMHDDRSATKKSGKIPMQASSAGNLGEELA